MKTLPHSSDIDKNKILQALEGSEFEKMSEKLNFENMYLFVPEGETKATYDAFKKWQKEISRTDDTHNPRYGAMEGNVYEGKALKDIASLPSKKELITKIAQGIKAVPTKVGKGINAVPNKVGRAFGAFKNKLEEDV